MIWARLKNKVSQVGPKGVWLLGANLISRKTAIGLKTMYFDDLAVHKTKP
jgi:hypothetical protein